jgi:hypothetical protein
LPRGRTFEEAVSEEGVCRHFSVTRAVVEEQDALFVRVGDLKDGDGVVQLRVHVVAGQVAAGV